MAKRLKRKGETVTFSVSVDLETRELLRKIADESYRGNVSELITQLAHEASRQAAAGRLLRRHGRAPWTDEQCAAFEKQIEAELAAQEVGRKRRKRVA